MRLLLSVCVLGACGGSTAPAPKPAETPKTEEPAPKVVYGENAKAEDPNQLPAAGTAPAPQTVDLSAIWDAPIHTLRGEPTSLGAHKGHALLVVNVASKCGFTPQYAALEALQSKYASRGFEVIGFPCNQFGKQEPGTADEIEHFCSATYGVTFPMMEKIDVNGDARHPIYKVLTAIPDTEGKAGDVGWNFEKFVISADGTHVTRFRSPITPDDPSVIAAIEASLPPKK